MTRRPDTSDTGHLPPAQGASNQVSRDDGSAQQRPTWQAPNGGPSAEQRPTWQAPPTEQRPTGPRPVNGVPAERPRGALTGIRHRLVTWMLAAVGVAVLLLGVPLAAVVRTWVADEEISRVARDAEQVIALVDRNPAAIPTLIASSAEFFDARVTLLDPAAAVIRDSEGVKPGTIFDDPVVAIASQGRTGGQVRGGAVVVAVPGQARGSRVIVRIVDASSEAPARIASASVVIVGLGATALVVGALLASWAARQLARPLESLADSARRLGEGDFGTHTPTSDIAEIERIASSLNATAERLRAALERSASLSADASHQLRTPLTALRLNLDALHAELQDPPPTLAAADAEVDRLEATIEELLTLTEAAGRPHEVDLRALTLSRLDAWRTLADAAGRAVRVTRTPAPAVRVRPAAVGQALQVLLDNALEHGVGDVTVWLEPVHRGGRSWVRLCVGDEGPGPQPEDLTSNRGRGLPLARSLVEAEGGRLVLDSGPQARLCLLLPAVDDHRPAARGE